VCVCVCVCVCVQLVSEHRFKCNDIRILINVDIIINFINWHGKLW
jgi:hypothetical protein